MSHLLHRENIERIPFSGHTMAERLEQRADEVAIATENLADPAVSVVIRSRNNVEQLGGLFDDIAAQAFDSEVELVVVDTESTDGSAQLARVRGATLVDINQDDFSYPKALNRGFAAASHEWVFSLVDHGALSHTQVLRIASRWHNRANTAAAYGMTLPNANASRTERFASAVAQPGWLSKPARVATKSDTGAGFMGANCLVVNREAWSETGGFDEAYGAGGEDGALGRAFLAAGNEVMVEPALAVHHTHGLGPINSLRQLWNWFHMGDPRDFKIEDLSYRTDMKNS